MAYADGVLNFGAQPFARPADDFHSYVYTDRGKDYCSHDWSGKVIAVHERAIDPDAELECHLVERRVGVLEEFGVKRLLARGYNAKEKPVERLQRPQRMGGQYLRRILRLASACPPRPLARVVPPPPGLPLEESPGIILHDL